MRTFVILLGGLLLVACAQQQQDIAQQHTPATSGASWRSEPVIYNGRRYTVSFRKLDAHARLARVAAPGRKLGATPGDGRIVRQIATSTVAHFTCRNTAGVRIRPGSLRPHEGKWTMVVVCP